MKIETLNRKIVVEKLVMLIMTIFHIVGCSEESEEQEMNVVLNRVYRDKFVRKPH